MVGGTIADLFQAQDRGFVMNVFAFCIFIGQVGSTSFADSCLWWQAAGPFIFGWVGMNLGIQWAYGVC